MDVETIKLIGQILGYIVTACVIVNFQLKKRVHILIFSAVINVLSALNILLVNELKFNSAVIICLVAVLQILVSLWHEKKGTTESLIEKIIFFVLYVGSGVIFFKSWLDIFSIVAAVLYMFAMLHKKEQNIRLFLLGNMSCWTAYHIIIHSSGVWAQVAGITSSIIALFRYRKIKK